MSGTYCPILASSRGHFSSRARAARYPNLREAMDTHLEKTSEAIYNCVIRPSQSHRMRKAEKKGFPLWSTLSDFLSLCSTLSGPDGFECILVH